MYEYITNITTHDTKNITYLNGEKFEQCDVSLHDTHMFKKNYYMMVLKNKVNVLGFLLYEIMFKKVWNIRCVLYY